MTEIRGLIKNQEKLLCKNSSSDTKSETNQIYNEMNRRLIEAVKRQYGKAYFGKVVIDNDEERKSVIAGERSVFVEYTGQYVYNFSCCFCVPVADEKLEEMIKQWNSFSRPVCIDNINKCNAIMKRIEKIGGVNFLWRY